MGVLAYSVSAESIIRHHQYSSRVLGFTHCSVDRIIISGLYAVQWLFRITKVPLLNNSNFRNIVSSYTLIDL